MLALNNTKNRLLTMKTFSDTDVTDLNSNLLLTLQTNPLRLKHTGTV